MIANAATTYCMMKDVHCDVSGGSLLILLGMVIYVILAWRNR